ncbi:MAG: metal ABC transporter solute-binding protein, Zn/Mn family, partial [Pseudonocardiaceae bacterium]
DDPAGDPHSYEASPADAADVAGADLVVFNGGGYDEFMDQFLGQTGNKPTVQAVALAKQEPHSAEGLSTDEPNTDEPNTAEPTNVQQPGTHSHEGGANEHVWYDLPVATAVAEHVAEELGKLEPTQAEQFTAAATMFGDGVDKLNAQVARIAERHAGARVLMTEPVAHYLVEAADLEDATPPEFVEAVEEETDPPAAATAATTKLLTDRQVQVLIYNPQTETPVTRKVRDAAQSAAVPVVTMTETLPENTTYLDWMSGQVDALNAALG